MKACNGALAYSTIFRSRLAVLSIALGCSQRSYATRSRIKKNLETRLAETQVLDHSDPKWPDLVSYLVDKGYVTKSPSPKTKYKLGYREEQGQIVLFKNEEVIVRGEFTLVDIQLSSANARSTIGAPTVDNAEEVLDFAIQIGLVSATKGNWTGAGGLAAAMRTRGLSPDPGDNPFILGAEIVVFARELLRNDVLTLRGLMQELNRCANEFTRGDIIDVFGLIVDGIAKTLRQIEKDKTALRDFEEFKALVDKNIKKRKTNIERRKENPEEGTLSLGVLEHRVSPRLEWLTDLRVLRKEEKNQFKYAKGEDFDCFLIAIDQIDMRTMNVDQALTHFFSTSSWSSSLTTLQEDDDLRAVLKSYALARPSIGPARIEDVCYLAALLRSNNSMSVTEWRDYILQLAKEQSDVTVSGDRFRRSPQLVHIKERFWQI